MMRIVEKKTTKLFIKIAQVLAPPPVLKVSEWADQNRRLSSEASAESGRWNTERAIYQKYIMNAINDSDCVEIVIMSSAQVGKTEIILNIIGYFIDYDPSPIICMQPTLEMAQTFSKDRLAPMLRDSPSLKGKVKDVKSKDSNNTILHKKFSGGQITMIGANSASGLASRPVRIILMDEVDRYPVSAGTEGNPIKLIEKRTTNFWNKKIVKVSTPTLKNISEIEKEYKDSSMEEWCVPCPCCNQYQPYEWERIRFLDITMECKYCGERFKEMEWKAGNGIFVAKYPERKRKRGFHLNEFASPWKHWDEIINDFKDAKKAMKEHGDIERMKVWVNTSLGLPWEEKGESASEESLLERREGYTADLPKGVLMLTASVDVQDDRFEIEVVGWGKGFESWGILYDKIHGDLAKDFVWDQLEEFLSKEFYFENKASLLIACSFVDTGGHFTTKCYKWLKKMLQKYKPIYGIKGLGGAGFPLIHKKSMNNLEKIPIIILGVDAGKELVLTRLKTKEVGVNYCHFPLNEDRGYNETYMQGLSSEIRVIKYKDGRPYLKWVKKSGIRNEPLDLRNYATAAAQFLEPNFDVLEEKVNKGINYMKRQTVKKNSVKKRCITKGVDI